MITVMQSCTARLRRLRGHRAVASMQEQLTCTRVLRQPVHCMQGSSRGTSCCTALADSSPAAGPGSDGLYTACRLLGIRVFCCIHEITGRLLTYVVAHGGCSADAVMGPLSVRVTFDCDYYRTCHIACGRRGFIELVFSELEGPSLKGI